MSTTYIQPSLDFESTEENPVFGMQCPRVVLGEAGTKILFVFDRVANEEIRSRRLMMSENVGGTFERALRYAMAQTETPVREFVAINLHEVRVSKLQGGTKDRARAACWRRVMGFAERYQPDIIVFFGREPADLAWPEAGKTNQFLMNRIRTFDYNGRTYRALWTISALDWIPTQPVNFNLVMLVGLPIRAMIDAIELRNRRTIRVPDNLRPIMIDTMPKFRKFMELLRAAPRPCIDTEADNLNRVANRLLSMQFCLDGKKTFFLPMQHRQSPWLGSEYKEIVDTLREWYENRTGDWIIYHNAKFDIGQAFVQLGVRHHDHRAYDIQAGEFSLDENRKWLISLAQSAYSISALEGLYGFSRPEGIIAKDDRANMAAKDINEIALYGQYDVITPWLICHEQIAEARSRGSDYDGFELAVADQISDMVISFAHMERWGLFVDKAHLMRLQAKDSEFNRRSAAVQEKFKASPAAQAANAKLCAARGVPQNSIYGDTVWMFNINKEDSKQILYFDVLGLEPLSMTKAGGSTDKNFQAQYKDVPEVALLGEHSKVKKLYTAFVQALWRRLATDPDAKLDGHIRCVFKYLAVLTGRSSASDPNLQQIPSRDSLSKPIKRSFVTRKGEIMMKVDYAAHEVRGWGNISGDGSIADVFRTALNLRREYRVAGDNRKGEIAAELKLKGDIHILNVKRFFNQDVDKKHPLRQAIKNVVFGVIYGKGARALAADRLPEKVKDWEKQLAAKQKELAELEAA